MSEGAEATVTPPDFEAGYLPILDRAAGYGEIVHDAVASLHPPDVSMDQMPASTVWRLHLTATASYMASVQCLRTKHSSLGGFIPVSYTHLTLPTIYSV